MRRWIIGIAIGVQHTFIPPQPFVSKSYIQVDFDVDDGPIIEGIYPPSLLLPAESENMSVQFQCHLGTLALMCTSWNSAFCSFPDSLQFDQGSQSHSFRIREQLKAVHTDKRPSTKDGFIYGYSHFTQKRDAASKRGYEQVGSLSLKKSKSPIERAHSALHRDPDPTPIPSSLLFSSVHLRATIPSTRNTDARGRLS